MTPSPPLLVFCHLRWDFVWQRPQQLMSRFARDRRVFFIEEPIHPEGAGDPPDDARFVRRESEGVTVLQPACNDPGPGDAERLDTMYARLASELVRSERLTDYTVWFYTP